MAKEVRWSGEQPVFCNGLYVFNERTRANDEFSKQAEDSRSYKHAGSASVLAELGTNQ